MEVQKRIMVRMIPLREETKQSRSLCVARGIETLLGDAAKIKVGVLRFLVTWWSE